MIRSNTKNYSIFRRGIIRGGIVRRWTRSIPFIVLCNDDDDDDGDDVVL